MRAHFTASADWWRRSALAQSMTFAAFDAGIVWVSTILAYWARFGGAIEADFLTRANTVSLVSSVVYVTIFLLLGLYRHVWRYVGVDTFLKNAQGIALGLVILVLADLAVSTSSGQRFAPLGVLVLAATFVLIGTTSIRTLGRLIAYMQSRTQNKTGKRVLILGAGDAGSLLLRDIENHPELNMQVVGYLDDDTAKIGKVLRGVPVLGPIDLLAQYIPSLNIDEVYIALPSASPLAHRRVLDICVAANVQTRVTPSLAKQTGHVGISNLRQVNLEDLLGRPAVQLDLDRIASTITDRTVLVTGAAGSIGSELCRQIMKFGPRRLVLADIDESRLYETFMELRRINPDSPTMQICDIRNTSKMHKMVMQHRPHLVLHAAAYKHVPMMEIAPEEAVLTNVLGTRNLLVACRDAGVAMFVLISTDKAVEPTSVMGATKAIAERLAFDECRRGLTACAVRFGNVLGSRGSVVPLFEDQIRGGGPVQVTHPEVTRFFMTISEAARLVLQAQALDSNGQLFVLEMGEPVKIVDLARKLIALSGVQTTIEFIGLRAAEKLHESLATADERMTPSGSRKVNCISAIPLSAGDFAAGVDLVIAAAHDDSSPAQIRALLERLVPDYDPGRAQVRA